jgi:hypothetical protein
MLQKKIDFRAAFAFVAVLAASSAALAQTADQAWLRYTGHTARVLYPRDVRALGTGAIEASAVQELRRNLGDLATGPFHSFSARAKAAFGGQTIVGTVEEVRKAFPDIHIPADLEPDGFWIYSAPCSDHYNGCGEHNLIVITALFTVRLPFSVLPLLPTLVKAVLRTPGAAVQPHPSAGSTSGITPTAQSSADTPAGQYFLKAATSAPISLPWPNTAASLPPSASTASMSTTSTRRRNSSTLII